MLIEKGYVVLNQGFGYNDEIYTIGANYESSATVMPRVFLFEQDAKDAMKQELVGMIADMNVGDFSYEDDLDTEPARKLIASLPNDFDPETLYSVTYANVFEYLVEQNKDIMDYVPDGLLHIVEVTIDHPLSPEEVHDAAEKTRIIHEELSK